MSPALSAQWARCREWILPALKDATEDELLAALSANRAQLWPGRRSAIVTELLVAEERKVWLWLAGGELEEILGMQPGIEAWARVHGAEAAWIDARKGWRRVMMKKGFVLMDGKLRMAL